ncbi:MAG TPA: TRAP transporter large permease [Phycisphaerae bacterium]|nr:TRAP transporter large permease [Phycisphaerae bacterium]HOJ74249.1 TRAP transporter large permease [Phycisphaerae bacterium]HOM51328.1 TRAP transporter large permease [Phycisphaerae bacterium]HON65135.1 TRAP transporter large permease [Phycisphaerae bacterium]HOQ86966.1 TRAP transporter large permease [Phycisphaerae bacterium]
MILLVLFGVFVLLLLLEVPISVALVLASAAAILTGTDYSLGLVVLKVYTASESFPLIAIPFFVMAGGIMGVGGMSHRLIALARSVVGNMHGGLAITSVVACMLFAAISGSTAATTAAIGSVMIPAIVHSGFSRGSAASLQACAGSIGIIIPPSIPMILMGYIGTMSIGGLFLAGVLPGILIGVALMVTSYIIARLGHHDLSGQSLSLSVFFRSLWRAVLPLLAVVFVIGGIMGGYVTATEAGIVAVLFSLVVSLGVYREMKWRDLVPVMADTAKITGIVVLCIGAASPFAWLLTVQQVPALVASSLLEFTQNPVVIKLIMLVVLLAVGTFLDLTPAMLILVPIFMPIAVDHLGMDKIHFGTMVVAALGIGQCTPPVGIALFVACSVAGTRMHELIRPLVPYLVAMIIVLLLVTFVPPLTLWLPKMLM